MLFVVVNLNGKVLCSVFIFISNMIIDYILAVAAPIKDVISNYSDYILYVVVPFISSAITGTTTYILGKRKAAKSEFTELVDANKKFRDEIKKELDVAKETIEKLQKSIEEKGKIIDEMQAAIVDLKQQIVAKETKISDMHMEMIKKDYEIQMLKEKQ